MLSTKEKIIEIATNFILEKGFNAFSYTDISKILNIKNAAIHYYFPTKEDLGIAVMKNEQEGLKNFIEKLQNRNATEIEQINALFGIYTGLLGEKKICALGSIGSDNETLSLKLRVEIQKDYKQVIDWLCNLLKSGLEKGIFKFQSDVKLKAEMIMNHLVSGIIIARFNGYDQIHFKELLNQVLIDIT